jgi:hypothetical protein|tara:strand:+ start:222 stop:419 length:198 start_codon:yes stop_codon:yes gene_type:complete
MQQVQRVYQVQRVQPPWIINTNFTLPAASVWPGKAYEGKAVPEVRVVALAMVVLPLAVVVVGMPV